MKKHIIISVVITILAVVFLIYVFLQVVFPIIHRESMGDERLCQTHLKSISNAMKEYASTHGGKLLLSLNWGDILREECFLSPNDFTCPGSNSKEATYAMNKNVIGLEKIPDDIVLLFDSKPGWNLTGGHELLAPENHNGKGCNILFGDFEVRFIEKDKLVELEWEVQTVKNQ